MRLLRNKKVRILPKKKVKILPKQKLRILPEKKVKLLEKHLEEKAGEIKLISEEELKLPHFPVEKTVLSLKKISEFERWAVEENKKLGRFVERSAVGILVEKEPGKYSLFDLKTLESTKIGLKIKSPTPGAFPIDKLEASKKVEEMIKRAEAKYGPKKIRLYLHHTHPLGFKRVTQADRHTSRLAFEGDIQLKHGEAVIGISHEEGGRSVWDGDKKVKLSLGVPKKK